MEKINTKIVESAELGVKLVAEEIKKLITSKNQAGKNTVLGLSTGGTPIMLYRELVKMHKEGLSFENVVCFNLDEYYPMKKDADQAYFKFMKEHFYDHVNVKAENIHIPNGEISIEQLDKHCEEYEQAIINSGGIDLQILGIGRSGHIGFNEPGSSAKSKTRLVTLDGKTRMDASGDFRNEDSVPRTAITMGMSTIINAKSIYLMAWGENKSRIISKAVEGEVSFKVPASYLQDHPNTTFIVDKPASSDLQRVKTPWLLENCDWTDSLILNAVCWLSRKTEKPILKLTDYDYNNYGVGELIAKAGSAYEMNLRVFNHLRLTITGWPGGKPGTKDERRPERAHPFPKRVVVFSPHPDDAFVSMGGTLMRLVDQGHDVHVVVQTSGNQGVADDDVINKLNFVRSFADHFDISDTHTEHYLKRTKEFFLKKEGEDEDRNVVMSIKSLIRKVEARASCRYSGVPSENVHFLDLPFYETGKKLKNEISSSDVDLTVALLNKLKPHQVFIAGDQADPNGTHRLCLDVIKKSFVEVEKAAWKKNCWVWLYRGTRQEWPISEIEMAVPLSPEEMVKKRQSIINHKSQKTVPVLIENSVVEKWQYAEKKNKKTAEHYDALGLPEYEGIEAFKKSDFCR